MQIDQPRRSLLIDLVILVVANFVTLYFFMSNGGSIEQTVVIYYFQTLTIAVFYYKKIRLFHKLSELIGKKNIDSKTKTAIDYRTAHEQFAYIVLIFVPILVGGVLLAGLLLKEQLYPNIIWTQVIFASIIFFAHHYWSYILSAAMIPRLKKRWTGYSIVPYKKLLTRILTIVLFSSIALMMNFDPKIIIIFILMKTLIDISLSTSAQLIRKTME